MTKLNVNSFVKKIIGDAKPVQHKEIDNNIRLPVKSDTGESILYISDMTNMQRHSQNIKRETERQQKWL